jgi:hypothetical protein
MCNSLKINPDEFLQAVACSPAMPEPLYQRVSQSGTSAENISQIALL